MCLRIINVLLIILCVNFSKQNIYAFQTGNYSLTRKKLVFFARMSNIKILRIFCLKVDRQESFVAHFQV